MITREVQKEIVNGLSASIAKQVLESIDSGNVPAEWDGHELREYMADLYHAERSQLMRQDRKRRRDYRNTVAVTYGL